MPSLPNKKIPCTSSIWMSPQNHIVTTTKKEGRIQEIGEAKNSGEERSEGNSCKESESHTVPFGTWQKLWGIVFRRMKTVLALAA